MKTIIIFGSKHGCTEKAVNILKQHLPEPVVKINIKKDPLPDLKEFDNIILGGSIYTGKIQKQIAEFSEKNLDLLLTKNVGLFICCGLEDKAQEQLQKSFSEKLYRHARTKGYFGYEYDIKKLNFLEKIALKVVAKVTQDKSMILTDNIKSFAEELSGGQGEN